MDSMKHKFLCVMVCLTPCSGHLVACHIGFYLHPSIYTKQQIASYSFSLSFGLLNDT